MSVEQNMAIYARNGFLARCEKETRGMKLIEVYDRVTVTSGPARYYIGKVVQIGPDRGNSTYAMVQGREPVPFTAIVPLSDLRREVL